MFDAGEKRIAINEKGCQLAFHGPAMLDPGLGGVNPASVPKNTCGWEALFRAGPVVEVSGSMA